MDKTSPRPTRFDVVHDLRQAPSPDAPSGRPQAGRTEIGVAVAAPVLCLGILLSAAFGASETSVPALVGLAASVVLLVVSLVREIRDRDLRGAGRWLPLLALPFLWGRPLSFAGVLVVRQVIVGLGTAVRHRRGREAVEYLWTHPVQFLALGFAAVITAGTVFLMLPAASTRAQGIPLVDALFTATSAVCVTGLTVVDTARDYTVFGQGVILALIQVGGIGVMTLSTLAGVVAGRHLGQARSGAVTASMETTTPIDAVRLVRLIVIATLVTEAVGALTLTLAFLPDMPLPRAVGFGVFHSVSAFCNAGFALWSDNLVPCAGNVPAVLTVALLIILGGLGFLVLAELSGRTVSRVRRRRAVSLHTRIVVRTTVLLLVVGTIVFALLEWHGALEGHDGPAKLLHAFFQSVTPRTAGFNTVPVTGLGGATLLLLLVLMFVGASPGSTGGGIKTTTAAAMLFAVRAFVRGRDGVEVAGRTIGPRTVVRAIALVALAGATVVVGFFLLLLTQDVPFAELLFESVSAFGTVGLSVGATTRVDDAGKLVLVAMMYVGRLGPLTLILLLGGGHSAPLRYPEEPVALA